MGVGVGAAALLATRYLWQTFRMKMPSPALSCLLLGLLGGVLLWLLGERTAAIIVFAVEALLWAGIHAATATKED